MIWRDLSSHTNWDKMVCLCTNLWYSLSARHWFRKKNSQREDFCAPPMLLFWTPLMTWICPLRGPFLDSALVIALKKKTCMSIFYILMLKGMCLAWVSFSRFAQFPLVLSFCSSNFFLLSCLCTYYLNVFNKAEKTKLLREEPCPLKRHTDETAQWFTLKKPNNK